MDPFTIVGDFCESKIIGRPEPLNCLTCFFLSYIPYLGLRYSDMKHWIIKNIQILLFFTGGTSFCYHWTGYYLFKQLDEIPMIFSIWMGLQYMNLIWHIVWK